MLSHVLSTLLLDFVMALRRLRLEDSKLAHQLMEKRWADITPSEPAEADADSMSSVPLSEANLIKVRQS